MPTPAIHLCVAAAATAAVYGRGRPTGLRDAAAFVVATLAADLDFLPGLLLAGDPTRYHHMWSHSLPVALLIGLAAGLINGRHRLLLCLTALSHPILDAFTVDMLGWYHETRGMPLFWPFSDAQFGPIAGLFQAPYVGFDFPRLMSPDNFAVLFREGAFLLAFLVVLVVHRRGPRPPECPAAESRGAS
jgi:membrane-bound metal-dependent hydrolase YbcI (DUF457 family)